MEELRPLPKAEEVYFLVKRRGMLHMFSSRLSQASLLMLSFIGLFKGVMQLIELASSFDDVKNDPTSTVAEANFFEMVQCGRKSS